MFRLPQEVIAEILKRLPVKTLLRFRCLSKSFCSLIDSPDFINLHLNHSLSTKNHLCLVRQDGFHVYTRDLNSGYEGNSYFYPSTEVCGSLNGLVALSNLDKDEVSLLNPATKQLLDLPKVGFTSWGAFYGFGYDVVHDDYKIVRMVQLKKDKEDVKVYSLRDNSWRKVVNLPDYLRLVFQLSYHNLHSRYGVYACGVLHWVLPRRGDSIFGLDLGAEEFHSVPVPEFGDLEDDFVLDVGALEGCLCVICNYCSKGVIDFWMMKEYGVKESWTKLFSIEESLRRWFKSRPLKPFFYWKGSGGEEKILMEFDHQEIEWYDLRSKRFKTLPWGAGDICVESLVPLKKGIARWIG